jgi:hypothetical protein
MSSFLVMMGAAAPAITRAVDLLLWRSANAWRWLDNPSVAVLASDVITPGSGCQWQRRANEQQQCPLPSASQLSSGWDARPKRRHHRRAVDIDANLNRVATVPARF